MISLENKVLKALKTNKLNPEILGERNWYNYFICVTELVWSRNNHDGYKIDVFTDNSKIEHLASVKI
ncbi:hypothetical protein HIO71_09310 [Chryseobacterium aquaticum]|jgi:hypothetical protein|uniref:Uncharacterized protein n=1 Tax=Chryseobacterium aquaticum TaxID=452084 RepID=A0A848N4H4_9FLAO|nr:MULTISPECIES: hypothetical protein [Chryseobacterium]NMR34404.1 hypothetical protein [Chryseobacterium aquaticum]NRQ46612.1 hypothetical protein [Chryseobacterium sp. C-204]